MKRCAVLTVCLAAALLLCACGGPAATAAPGAALVGKWQGEAAGIAIAMELRQDGSYTMVQNDATLEGSYSVQGNAVTSTYQDQTEVEYFVVQGDTLTLSKTDGGPPALTLTRVK